MNILRPPYIKPKKSCFNPLVVHGIPRFADSINNPKCVDTPDYQKFWEEQVHYCLHGFTSGSMTVPGRYYYYSNFTSFNTVMGTINPHIDDLHLEMSYFVDWCKANHKNGLFPKKRRGGISEFFNVAVIDHGYRFVPGYKAGIAAGHMDYTLDFMSKWTAHDERIVPEFKIKKLINQKDEKVAGWKVKDSDGFREYGTSNTIYARTMGENPGLFKGLYLNDVVGEEMGEFKHSKEFHEATKHCLMMGSVQMGNAWYYGTGDKMDQGMKAFQHMWNNPDLYNIERFFIKSSRFHFPFYGGAKDAQGKIVEVVPNLMHLTPEERLGVEDIKAAEESLMKVRAELTKTGDTQALIKECQNNPLEVNEVFRKTSSNHFDATILNDIAMDISGSNPRYIKYKFNFKTNDKGEYLTPLQVEKRPAKDVVEESECILMSDDGDYVPNSQKLYCAGIDSYDLDKSKTSDSLGGMVVLIRDNDFVGRPKMKPVAMIRCRPKHKETFYNMCMMLCVYYNLVGTALVDVRNGVILKHFEENRCRKYLARRPRKFESENSEQVHEFGVSLNKFSKPRMVSLMQTYVSKHGKKIVFLKLIEELQNYDELMVDSDGDAADALGIALMQDACMDAKPMNEDAAAERAKRFQLNDHSGSERKIDYDNPYKDHDRFGQ